MRWRPWMWLSLSMVCFLAAVYFWQLGDKWAAQKNHAPISRGTNQIQPADPPAKTASHSQVRLTMPQAPLLSQFGHVNAFPTRQKSRTNRVSALAYRLTNTTKPLRSLVHSDTAILLGNALLDTASSARPAIPDSLRSQGDPGSYVVQSRGALDNRFRALLTAAGATVISYIPNNAYLVRASSGAAQQIQSDPQTQVVLPYEPYYKLKPSLLQLAVEQRPLPDNAVLNVLVFADARQDALDGLQKIGAQVLAETTSPFGPVLTVKPPTSALADIAGLPAVQEIEPNHVRHLANDLSRVSDGVSTDTQTQTNYLDLTGANILVAVDDTGIDATHPDLSGRVRSDSPFSALDPNGHGTHVAGIIASSGGQSSTVTNAIGSINPGTNGQYRGKAPSAILFSMPFTNTDAYLQETAARTNALISNNSWTYGATHPDYDLAAASYDAAVRDSVPEITGSQGVSYVFPSGNEGSANSQDLGNDDGEGGNADSVESPGTAKNVITVGAIEQMRSITNQTVVCDPAFGGCVTNQPWLPSTDSSNQVAGFSGRGNVGIGVEGDFGRFKPDVVAPGTFVVSTRSSQWDEAAYYNPTNSEVQSAQFLTLNAFSSYVSGVFVPFNAVGLTVNATAVTPLINLPISLTGGAGTVSGVNQVSLPADGALSPLDTFWIFTITNATPQPVIFDWQTVLVTTNNQGDFLQVLKGMNDSLGGLYRYESGTSLAAADVSGLLALMQEFFNVRVGVTNSPALMKALLINGARSVASTYDFQVRNSINFQGWGQVFLPTSLPGSLSNMVTSPTAPSTMYVFDQSPTNALATGQSHTRFFSLSPDGQGQPLRVTLAWTDPPGNPAASVKLVNDLDLVVTNMDTGDVFFGNDIQGGAQFNLAWDTNQLPQIDAINNVENVYLKQPLGTNYSVTVIGHRVNVNAVTAHPNDVVQDYALVVSSGDGLVTNAITLTSDPGKTLTFTVPNVLFVTNAFPNDPENPVSGGLLLHQHVGANTPLLGTNTLPLSDLANAVLTTGMTNQWHFYVLSNDFNYTNVSFVTFMPPELGVPRMGVTNIDNVNNATRPEADIDLYVSTDPSLTNLSLAALNAADKSVGRGGTEVVVKNNATPKSVYYAAVKSEDQQAAEYSILAVFSLLPPSSTDNKGNVLMRGIPVPAVIPPGIPPHPQAALVMGINVQQTQVRRVVVTNTFTHSLPGNLVGTLSHDTKFAVLNNHTCALDPAGDCITNTFNYIYEDNGERNVFGSRHTDGPGTLQDFIGEQGIGVWLMTMVNSFPSGTGEVDRLTIKLEPQNLSGTNTVDLQPNAWFYDAVDVPGDATNLTVCVTGNTFPLDLYIARAAPPTQTAFDFHLRVNPPGGCLPVTVFDSPPLIAGRYYIGVYNPNFAVQHIRVSAQIFSNPFAIASSLAGSGAPVPIGDDVVTYSYLTNLTHLPISSLDVGMLIQDPRISDLALTLISPNGTRVLLFENRGATSTNGLGTFSSQPNSTQMVAFYTNNFDDVLTGPYAPGAVFDGWNVLRDQVSVYPELPAPWLSNNVAVLSDGIISNNLPTTNSTAYSLSFDVSHAPYIVGTVGWWPFDGDGSDIFGGFNGLLFGDPVFSPVGEVGQAFVGDGIASRMIVPRAPQLDVGQGNGFTIEGWINPKDVTVPGPLVEWNDPSNPNGQGVQLWLDGSFSPNGAAGAISAGLWDTSSQLHAIDTAAGVVTNGGWQHVALTFDRASLTASLYINGALAKTLAVSATNFIPRTSGDLYFGYHPAPSPNFVAFAGGLDEFGLYNRVLSDCEIAAIFKAGAAGKHDPDILSCPVKGTLQLLGSGVPVTTTFSTSPAPGPGGAITGLTETVTVPFTAPAPGAGTTPIIVTSLDPNLAVDNFVLSAQQTNYLNGLMHFTENTNLATIPIKFAPAPYAVSNIPPTLVFSNEFESAFPGLYNIGATIPGRANAPTVGTRDWTVANGPVTVVANTLVDALGGTNCVALGGGALQCPLPTIPGSRYRLTYSVRGPGMVGWWNGATEPLSHRAWDLIGGNHGAYLNGATNTRAGFVNLVGNTSSLFFPGVIDPQNNLASKIELGDPASLRFTNSFTIEGWINPSAVQNFVPEQTEQLFFRGDSRECLDPYYLGLERVTANQMDLVFHVEDNKTGNCGVILESAGQPVQVGQWQHVAAVFEANTFWQTNAPWPTNELRLYVNGQRLTAQNNAIFLENPPGIISSASGFTAQAPFANLDPAYSPGVSIGNRSRGDNSEPYTGYIDELSVYGRALTDPEIAAIAAAGTRGKADISMPPAQSLAKLAVLVNDVQIDTGFGDNSQWTTHSVEFTADRTNLVLTLQSLLPGTLVDGISLTELPSELNYLPEDSLASLNGEDAFGVWTLEIDDTRAGANVAANSASLLNWQLNFILQPSNAPPVVHLQHGVIYTNTLVAGAIQNFVVDVPQWASNATNILVSATDRARVNPLPVGVLWDPFNPDPLSPTKAIVWPTNNTGSKLLSSTAAPPDIAPGQPYYLTITNPNPVAVTFAYGVWFDIPKLTNCLVSPGFVAEAGIPRYFEFDVPSNGVPAGTFPQAVSFYLTGLPGVPVGVRSNVTVVLSQHLPLPDLSHYDYISSQPDTNDDILMVVTNTTPFPIQTNTWYVGVFNQADTAVPFSVQACASTAYPTIVPLTNDVPFVAGLTNPFVATPGPPQQFFFQFQVTNDVDSILFEMYNLSGDADLVLQKDVPPTMAPYYAGSFEPGTNWEQIVVRTSPQVPSLLGNWYVGVYNNESANVTYSLRGIISSNGLLDSIQEPPVPTVTPLPAGKGVLLSWYSVVGEYYQVQSSAPSPVDFQPVPGGLLRATTPLTTFVVSGAAGTLDIYRIVHISELNLPMAPLQIQLWTNNQVRISWSSAVVGGILQYADSPFGPWFNANLPVTLVGGQFVTFDNIGAIPRYYRLLQ